MSNKKKHKKKNNNQGATGLLGDNRAKRNQLLIGIVALSIMAIIIFCYIMPSMNQPDEAPNSDNRQEIQDTIKISPIGDPQLVDEAMYNIWFDIVTDGTQGTITIEPSIGYVLQYNKENGQVSETPVTTISTDDLDNYDYIWVFDKEADFMLCNNVVTIENKTTKKDASMFLFCKNTAVSFLTKEGYENMQNNWDKIINGDYEGGLNE